MRNAFNVVGEVAYIELGRGLVCTLDAEDLNKVSGYTWHAHRGGGRVTYVSASAVEPLTVYIHRLISAPQAGFVVDHIDGDGLNNRKYNLRNISHADNMKNRLGNIRSVSGIKGVYPHRNGRWRAKIKIDRKQISLGVYQSKEDAADAYRAAELIYFGKFARAA